MAVSHATTFTASFPHATVALPRPSYQPRRTMPVAANNSITKSATCTLWSLPRRLLLLMGFTPIWSRIDRVLGAPIPQMEEPEVIRTLKLPGGVRVQDIVDGEGQVANEGDIVEFNYVCRRANGYFVYSLFAYRLILCNPYSSFSTVDQFSGAAMPVTLPLDEKQIIKGLKDVLIGMKTGGKRRALIPPSMGYINEKLKPIPEEFGPRRSLLSHANEPLVFEVQLLKIL